MSRTPPQWKGARPSTPYPCDAKHVGRVVLGREGGRVQKCATPEKKHPHEGQLWLSPRPGHAMRKSLVRSRISYYDRKSAGPAATAATSAWPAPAPRRRAPSTAPSASPAPQARPKRASYTQDARQREAPQARAHPVIARMAPAVAARVFGKAMPSLPVRASVRGPSSAPQWTAAKPVTPRAIGAIALQVFGQPGRARADAPPPDWRARLESLDGSIVRGAQLVAAGVDALGRNVPPARLEQTRTQVLADCARFDELLTTLRRRWPDVLARDATFAAATERRCRDVRDGMSFVVTERAQFITVMRRNEPIDTLTITNFRGTWTVKETTPTGRANTLATRSSRLAAIAEAKRLLVRLDGYHPTDRTMAFRADSPDLFDPISSIPITVTSKSWSGRRTVEGSEWLADGPVAVRVDAARDARAVRMMVRLAAIKNRNVEPRVEGDIVAGIVASALAKPTHRADIFGSTVINGFSSVVVGRAKGAPDFVMFFQSGKWALVTSLVRWTHVLIGDDPLDAAVLMDGDRPTGILMPMRGDSEAMPAAQARALRATKD